MSDKLLSASEFDGLIENATGWSLDAATVRAARRVLVDGLDAQAAADEVGVVIGTVRNWTSKIRQKHRVLSAMFTPKGLDYYVQLVGAGSVTVDLSRDEKAVFIKIHDHGVSVLTKAELDVLYSAVATIKDAVRG